MKFRLFGQRAGPERPRQDRPRYVSSLQRDIQKYYGWSEDMVAADYRAKKSVHTIMTLGYMEYSMGVLDLTQKGRMLMQNVSVKPVTD